MMQNHDITSLVPVCKFSAHGTYITRVLLSPDVKHLATCSADHTARVWAIEPNLGDPNAPTPTQQLQKAATALPRSSNVPKRPVSADEDDEEDSESSSESEETESSDDSPPQPIIKRPTAAATTTTAQAITNTSKFSRDIPFGVEKPQPEEDEDPDQPLPLEMTLEGHQRWVWDCAFSADSAYLVTACSDHYARLWELSSQSIIRQYNGHHRGAVCVALNDTAIT
jgi:target of rapamycin complex subunit LST8